MLLGQIIQPEEEIRERAGETISPFHGSPYQISEEHPNSRGDQASQPQECEAENPT